MAEMATVSVVRRNRPGTKAEVNKDAFGIRCQEERYHAMYKQFICYGILVCSRLRA